VAYMLLSELRWGIIHPADRGYLMGSGNRCDVYDPARQERIAIVRTTGDIYHIFFWPITEAAWSDVIDVDELTLACLIAPCVEAGSLKEWGECCASFGIEVD
jgi:hypothetical protein